MKLDRAVPRGAALSVRRDELPALDADAYRVFQLVGLAVEEQGGRALGVVADVENGPANDALVLDSGLLLPSSRRAFSNSISTRARSSSPEGFADAE